MTYLIGSLVFIIYLILAWFAGAWLHLVSPSIWILRALLALIGLAGFIYFLWLQRQKDRDETVASGDSPDDDELALLFREANAKLGSARSAARRIANLPLFVVLGETGSAKTSTVLNSGLRPELLAGHVHSGTQVVPTKTANLWLAGPAVFAEASAAVWNDANHWKRFIRLLKPGRLNSVVSGKIQAPRAVILCFDAEAFLQGNASEQVTNAARSFRARLGELADALGSETPVYVIFTRFDRVPFFTEFVTPFTEAEARQVFGATFPLDAASEPGVWAERQTARLTHAFGVITHTLMRLRPEMLDRENDREKRPAIYEFPREFRKMRKIMAEFLVELCRPSQLSTGPFLRGVYFSGVRPVTVSDPSPGFAAAPVVVAEPSVVSDATSFFKAPAASAPIPPVMRPSSRSSRRVPEWAFLAELFHEVLLRDRGALALSGASVKTSSLRRFLLAAAVVACLLFSLALGLSWWQNSRLEQQTLNAARGISAATLTGEELPSLDALRRLDALRELVSTLSAYQREGAPLRYRWGLYVGNSIYPDARRLYFNRFRQLLFAQTQSGLVSDLRSLPANPGPEYGLTYDTLKAYLITTSNHDKSTRSFLAPVLFNRWSAHRALDNERLQLAQKQFEFYGDELRFANPYTDENDGYAVEKARRYLAQFAGVERVYRALLADAAKTSSSVNFNARYPGSAAVLVDNREINGAFTKNGADFFLNAIKNPEKYFTGEQWVLGNQNATQIDSAQLGEKLRARYASDLENEWRAYLKAAIFQRYANLGDAARKLSQIAGNQSPLLELLSLASQNTVSKDSSLTASFQPVQSVVPPKDDQQLISAPNQAYMRALLTLQSSVEQLATQNPPSDAGSTQVLTDAASAKVITRQMAQGFRPDPAGHVDQLTQKLMEDPITQVEALLKVLGPAELNGKGKGLCAQMRSLWMTYPFNPNSSNDATLPEVNTIFRKPDGALWSFYDQNLQKLLLPQGAQYIANPTATTKVNPVFLQFFNQEVSLSNVLYANGSPDPKFTYTLTPLPTEGIQQLGLTIDGQTFSYASGTAPAPKTFVWQGSGAHEVKATVRLGNGPDLAWAQYGGLWGVFRFFDKADQWQYNGTKYDVEWVIRVGSNPLTLPNGRPLTVRFELDMGGAPPILRHGYFSRFTCVADVAH